MNKIDGQITSLSDEMGRLNPSISLPLYTADWDRQAYWITQDGEYVEEWRDGFEAFAKAAGPCILVLEPTFESYQGLGKEKKNATIRTAEENDVLLWATTTKRSGGMVRQRVGSKENAAAFHTGKQQEKIRKGNKEATRAIFQIVTDTRAHLKPVCIEDYDELNKKRSKAANEFIYLRSSQYPKDEIKELFQCLPHPSEVPSNLIPALIDKNSKNAKLEYKTGPRASRRGAYNKTFVISCLLAAKQTTTRNEYEQVLGIYEHGYPNVFRSNIYHYRVPSLANVSKHYNQRRGWNEEERIRVKEAEKLVRKAARYIRYCYKNSL